MILTINIDTNSNKAQAFLDFIKIKEQDNTEAYALIDEQIQILEERKQRHINKKSKSYSWSEIKDVLKSSLTL